MSDWKKSDENIHGNDQNGDSHGDDGDTETQPDTSPAIAEDEKAGYCRPPKKHRFKSGKSGNPSGKKKPQPSVAEQVDAAWNKKITVIEGGKKRRLTKQQVMFTTLANNAAKGDIKAIAFLLKLKETHQDKNTEFIDPSVLDIDDQAIIDNFLKQTAIGEEITGPEDTAKMVAPKDVEANEQPDIDTGQLNDVGRETDSGSEEPAPANDRQEDDDAEAVDWPASPSSPENYPDEPVTITSENPNAEIPVPRKVPESAANKPDEPVANCPSDDSNQLPASSSERLEQAENGISQNQTYKIVKSTGLPKNAAVPTTGGRKTADGRIAPRSADDANNPKVGWVHPEQPTRKTLGENKP